MNTEKGLRRITWVISAIGLAILVFGVVLGISLQNQFRIQFQSTERAVKNDPQWVEFSSQARSRALKLIRKDHWEGFYENSDMPIAIGSKKLSPALVLNNLPFGGISRLTRHRAELAHPKAGELACQNRRE